MVVMTFSMSSITSLFVNRRTLLPMEFMNSVLSLSYCCCSVTS